MRREAFGFEEELVLRLVGEANDLVLDGGAVARADGLDLAGVHGRAVDVAADDVEGFGGCGGDVAGDLAKRDVLGAEGERGWVGVAGLLFEAGPIDGAAVEARRCSGLEAAAAEAEALEGFAEERAGGLAGAAGGVLLLAAVDEAVEEGSGGDDGGGGEDVAAVAELEASDAAGCGIVRVRRVVEEDVGDFGLLDEEVGLLLEELAHADAVEGLVALGAGAPDGGAAGGVEEPELDAGGIGDFADDAAEGVDLADEVAFGDAADGGVAAHLGDQVEVEGEQGGAQTHAGGGHGGLAAGVSGADDHYIELFGEGHRTILVPGGCSCRAGRLVVCCGEVLAVWIRVRGW